MRVELLLAYADHTWATDVVTVPEDELAGVEDVDGEIVRWALDKLSPLPEYHDVVFWGVYGYPAD